MKFPIFALFVCLAVAPSAFGQGAAPALPNLPEDAVIAVFDDGVKFTMGDFNALVAAQPAQNQQMAKMNAKAFIQWWAGMRKLFDMALQEKLDQDPATKMQLEYDRTVILAQSKLNRTLNSLMPSQDEVKAFYESHKDRYKQVKVKAIYIAYGDAVPSGKKAMTEADAKARASQLLAQIRSGADFVKLARENSDDETSREKDADFATFRLKDNIPEALRKAIFDLKEGDVTEPVQQPNGYYLLKAAEVVYTPLDQVSSDLMIEIRQQQYSAWLKQHNDSVKVQYPNPAFGADK